MELTMEMDSLWFVKNIFLKYDKYENLALNEQPSRLFPYYLKNMIFKETTGDWFIETTSDIPFIYNDNLYTKIYYNINNNTFIFYFDDIITLIIHPVISDISYNDNQSYIDYFSFHKLF